MDKLAQWAQSRETSTEIARAIRDTAPEGEMDRVWESPTPSDYSRPGMTLVRVEGLTVTVAGGVILMIEGAA